MSQPPADTSAWPTRTLRIGNLDASGQLQVWTEGEVVKVELGFQGAYMITPAFEVAAEAGDGDQACWFVRVSTGDPAREIDTSTGVYPAGLSFGRDGQVMRAGPLFHLVGEGFEGVTERMDVAVFGPDFEATHSVTYVLESSP